MNKLGFGFLRLPYAGEEIDYPLLDKMVDTYIQRGGRYFDTSYTYLKGQSEEAICKSVVQRYSRESVRIANKLPGYLVHSREELREYFEESCRRCGTDYFDVYLLHWLNTKHYEIAQKYDAFGFLQQLKEEGKAKKIGFSFHDTADVLDRILSEHPEVDYVLLQINYLDWESDAIQSRKCYETAVRHGKTVIVMEPVKGGTLAQVPEEAEKLLRAIDDQRSPAFHALSFVQALPGVEIALSGMNTMEQLEENLCDPIPMAEREHKILENVVQILNSAIAVPCTGCGYCKKNCPRNIAIPEYFRLYNEYARKPRHDWKIIPAYEGLGNTFGKASDCIGCGACEKSCPQKLAVREYLEKVKEAFEE